MKIQTKKYIEREIYHYWDKVKLLFDGDEKEKHEAKRLMEVRLHEMNNLHAKIESIEKEHDAEIDRLHVLYLPRLEYEEKHKAVELELKHVTVAINRGIGIIIFAQIVFGAFIYLFFNHLTKN